jgi:nitrogen regulatory protein PII
MKLVTALLRSEQFPEVKSCLFEADLRHFTATSVMGTATATEQRTYRGVAREVSLFRRVKLEIVVEDNQVETATEAISRGAKGTGGWGRMFVTDVLDSIVIWDGSADATAAG